MKTTDNLISSQKKSAGRVIDGTMRYMVTVCESDVSVFHRLDCRNKREIVFKTATESDNEQSVGCGLCARLCPNQERAT